MRIDVRALALALAAALACSATDVAPGDFDPVPGAPAPIATDATLYTLAKVSGAYEAEAQAIYANASGRTLFYRRCASKSDGPMFLVRRTGPDSTAPSFVGGGWACVGGVPTGRVLPGGTLSARVWLGSTDSPNARPPIDPAERIGRFRIEFALCSEYAADSDDCVSLPAAARESNVFEVQFAPAVQKAD
jgi:hypothetical protein